MKQNKIIALMPENLPWMYYGKFKRYLEELNHPFNEEAEFIIDEDFSISEERIKNSRGVIFYYRDPLKQLYPRGYKYAKRIEQLCKKHDIPFINSPDALSKTSKSIQLPLLKNAGFNVAETFAFSDVGSLQKVDDDKYPLFIRVDNGHDSDNVTMQGPFDSFNDLKENYSPVDFSDKRHLKDEVAIQWIDTEFPDGLYRRYRAVTCNGQVVPGNLYISGHWYVHGVVSKLTSLIEKEQEEFSNYQYSDEEVNYFNEINDTLGLNFSAIDYTYKDGEIVIWEANPHPAFPKWYDEDPIRSQITNMLADHYLDVIQSN